MIYIFLMYLFGLGFIVSSAMIILSIRNRETANVVVWVVTMFMMIVFTVSSGDLYFN